MVRRAQLVVERETDGLTLVASVNVGRGPGSLPMMAVVEGRVEGASFCS